MKGYDYYSIEMDINEFFEYVRLNHIAIYRFHKNKKYTFYSTYKYRSILNVHKKIHYEYSTGILGMLFRFNFDKIIPFIFSCILLFGLSNTIFEVEIIGESIKHKEMIQQSLNQYKIPFFYLNKNIHKQLIQLNQYFNWYEVIHKGSKITINYLPRFIDNNENEHSFDLIAKKEGVIALFDVRKGNKVVHLNQKVKKGDLLVSKITIDSSLNEKTSEVIGSVYAYTFERVDVEIDNIYPIGIGYYVCLFKSRLSLDLNEDERIIREISLQFEEDFDTIRMSNYYVLYEKISIVGE